MPCGSGCCGPPKATPLPQAPTKSDADSCCRPSVDDSVPDDDCNDPNDDCCDPSGASAVETNDECGNCCGPAKNTAISEDNSSSKTASNACNDACCQPRETKQGVEKKNSCSGGADESSPDDDCCGGGKQALAKDECCAPKPKESKCGKGCCSAPSPPRMKHEEVPGCCEGKPSPCCDSTCIDRLALRECKSGKPTPSSYGTPTTKCSRGEGDKPCNRHERSAREYYQAKLDALGCICRALLALGQESCCATRERSSLERKHSTKRVSTSPATNSCCATGVCTSASSAAPRPRSNKECASTVDKPQDDGCLDGCCDSVSISTTDTCGDGCCGEEKTKATNGCADACSDEKKSPAIVEKIEEILSNTADIENSLAGKEHVILSISGMTCTGCETKLKRTLGTLASVKNLKTSLVLARAEFDIDTTASSAVEVMKHLERTTEFKCERVMNQGSSLDLVCRGDRAALVNGQWPDGVIEVVLVGKDMIRVDFDAKVVGARDLMNNGWKADMELAPPRADPTLDAGSRHVRHVGYMTLVSAFLTIPVLVLAWAPLPKREIAYGSASLALATIVQVVIAGPFYPKALKALVFSRVIEMDLLIVLSTSTAYIFSVVSFGYLAAGRPLSTGEFFETSTLLVTLIMVGRYFAALARQKAVESISIRSLQTPTAILVESTGAENEIDARLLQYGDIFKLLPDCRAPTDGTVVSGSSEIDESMITGESKPVEKYIRSTVIAGSINGSGTLLVRLTRLPGDNTISTIAGMVDEAKLSKPKIQDIADRVASYFVPVVITLTIITFVTWVGVGVGVRRQSGTEAVIQAITYAITVLIVSCPCAIGLAVPMVIVIASGIAADKGVIFKSAESIEQAYKTTDVVFDKTGTLTEGKLSVMTEEHFGDHTARALLLGLVSGNKHPVSAAVVEHLKANAIAPSAVLEPKNLTGEGVEGTTATGQVLRAGNSRWLGVSSHTQVQAVLSKGFTSFCFTVDGTLTAIYGLEDSLRPDAASTISKLQAFGITTHILSGDDDGAVQAVACGLNIPAPNVRSSCTPGDKQAYIQSLLSPPTTSPTSPKRKPVVIFCGDGTNDAVALAQATIGIHISSTSGTDVAQSASDIVLMRPNLSGILTAIAVSKKSMHRIAFNFGWSFVYNLFAILLGAGAFVNARIPPEYAGLGELVSVLPVVAAAVMLRWSKI